MDTITIKSSDIDDQKQLIQDDIECILDGLDNEYVERVCQVVVDRLNILKNNSISNANAHYLCNSNLV